MYIAALIAIMMVIVVGVNLIPSEEVVEEAPLEGGLVDIPSVFFYIFVAIILLVAVAWIAGNGGLPIGRWISNWTTRRPNPKSLGQEFAARSWGLRADRGNLDRLLGVQIVPIDGTEEESLYLDNKTLLLSKEFIWYLDGKSPRGCLYKIVGLNQRHRNLNSIFILGKDANTANPFLLRLPPSYLREPLEECLRWCTQSGKGDIIKEV